VWGEPFSAPTEVQTLDECVLLRRAEPDRAYFDERLGGWHVYGVDGCCRAIRDGQTNYVLPLLTHHDSRSVNLAGLDEAHRAIWAKHGPALGPIWTTCGRVGPPAPRPGLVRRIVGRIGRAARRRLSGLSGVESAGFNYYGEVIDELLADHPVATVLHANYDREPIEVSRLYPQARRPRRVVHTFGGLDPAQVANGVVVVPPALAVELEGKDGLPVVIRQAATAVVCLPAEVGYADPQVVAHLRSRADRVVRGRSWSGHGPVIDFYRLSRAERPR
ncbi:MAG TPA: hypothetical protein VM597_26185, partial [Gemmataceae bacterium]|nr:hypothetical protein [Gemmataceae bacterium]